LYGFVSYLKIVSNYLCKLTSVCEKIADDMGDMNMIRKGLIAFILLAIFLVGCNTDKDEAEKTFQVSGSSEEADEETNKESNDDESVVDTENDTIILPDEELQKQSEGESVNNLQQALIALGYPLEVTGVYDEKTNWAVSDLQLQEDSLYINGIYNQEMKEHMEEQIGRASCRE